jgi:hypothetical protein
VQQQNDTDLPYLIGKGYPKDSLRPIGENEQPW